MRCVASTSRRTREKNSSAIATTPNRVKCFRATPYSTSMPLVIILLNAEGGESAASTAWGMSLEASFWCLSIKRAIVVAAAALLLCSLACVEKILLPNIACNIHTSQKCAYKHILVKRKKIVKVIKCQCTLSTDWKTVGYICSTTELKRVGFVVLRKTATDLM